MHPDAGCHVRQLGEGGSRLPFKARTGASLRASVISSAPLCFGVTPIHCEPRLEAVWPTEKGCMCKASLGRPKVRKFLQARGALERNRSNPSLSVSLPHSPAARTRFHMRMCRMVRDVVLPLAFA